MSRIMGISQQRYSMLGKSKNVCDVQSVKILAVLNINTTDVENIFTYYPPIAIQSNYYNRRFALPQQINNAKKAVHSFLFTHTAQCACIANNPSANY